MSDRRSEQRRATYQLEIHDKHTRPVNILPPALVPVPARSARLHMAIERVPAREIASAVPARTERAPQMDRRDMLPKARVVQVFLTRAAPVPPRAPAAAPVLPGRALVEVVLLEVAPDPSRREVEEGDIAADGAPEASRTGRVACGRRVGCCSRGHSGWSGYGPVSMGGGGAVAGHDLLHSGRPRTKSSTVGRQEFLRVSKGRGRVHPIVRAGEGLRGGRRDTGKSRRHSRLAVVHQGTTCHDRAIICGSSGPEKVWICCRRSITEAFSSLIPVRDTRDGAHWWIHRDIGLSGSRNAWNEV